MGKAKRFNSYDRAVSESRKLAQSYGQARQNLSGIGSSFRSSPLEPPTAVSTASSGGTGDGKFLTVSLSADQTTNLGANDHVEFDTKDEDGGIVLQTGSGQADGIFELSSGKKYELSGVLRPEFSGATGQLVVVWYDITNSAEIGSRAIYESQTHVSHNANQPLAEALVTPATNITVELRIISVTALTALANEYCTATLFEIALGGSSSAAAGGGGGSVSFPITPTINDHGNVGTTTEDIDLSTTDGHVHKITLTGNPTLTFSNPPSSGTQIEFEIEFVQDGTGGRTITLPASVAETVTIASGADKTTIVTFRTNDGGTTYHAIPALRGAITPSGSFANTTLNNLASVSINTSLISDTDDNDDLGSSSKQWKDLYIDGIAYVDEIQSGGSIKPEAASTSDLGTALLTWDDLYVDTVRFPLNAGAVPTGSSDNQITTTTAGMYFNLDDANDIYYFYYNGVQKHTLTNTTLTLAEGVLLEKININDSSADPATNGEITRNGTDVKVYSGGGVVDLSSIITNPLTADLDLDHNDIFDIGQLRLRETTTNPVIQLERDDATPNDADNLGTINWKGDDDGGSSTTFANMFVESTDVSAGSEDATFYLSVIASGSLNLTQFIMQTATWTFQHEQNQTTKLTLYRNDTSPGDNDVIGTLDFDGETDTSARVTYGSMFVRAEDVSNASKDASFELDLMKGNSTTTFIRINDSGTDGIELFDDVTVDSSNLNVTESGGEAMTLSKTATEANINTTDILSVAVAGTNQVEFDNGTFYPSTDDDIDLGKSGNEFKDLYIDGIAYIDELQNNGSPIAVNDDIDLDFASTIDFNGSQSTVGSAGIASAPPPNPTGYIIIKHTGTEYVIPYYAKS